MILTVTLNPAIDKILILNRCEIHKLHRLEENEISMAVPGGKGVNIALSLNLLGDEVIATGFAGGHTGHMLCDSLRQAGITTSFIFTKSETRTNTSILDRNHETLTELNDFGQEIELSDLEFFMESYHGLLHRIDYVVLAGSLPRGIPENAYRDMIILAREHNKKVLVHTSPKYLDTILDTSPFLINPDMRSYHELNGKPLDGVDQFLDQGSKILLNNPDTEFVIFTHRIENVVAVTREKSYVLRPKKLKIINMLGYGDAYLAGFLHAYINGMSTVDVLKYASSAGLTNVENLSKETENIQKITENIKRIDIEEVC